MTLNRLPIRVRLTLYVVMLLSCVCTLLTALAIYNANQTFVIPLSSDLSDREENMPRSSSGTPELYMVPDTASDGNESSILIMKAGNDFNSFSLWVMAAVICIGGFSTYFLLGRALKPLRSLSDEIGEITENELSQRIEGFISNDEIGSLADSFNQMLVRLDKAFSDQKRFSSDAAHELKTPIAVMKTNLDVLRLDDRPTLEAYDKTICVMERQTKRMAALVDNLFAMTTQGGYEFNDELDFDEMFAGIVSELESRINEKKLTVVLHPCGYRIIANSVMLTRAFSNLVENAVKYNVVGGSIDIYVQSNGKWYTATVSDNGIGIPPEKIEQIFKPFYCADKSRSTEGAGLGLAIVSEIVHRHGGSVSARSSDGETVFIVTLPVVTR